MTYSYRYGGQGYSFGMGIAAGISAALAASLTTAVAAPALAGAGPPPPPRLAVVARRFWGSTFGGWSHGLALPALRTGVRFLSFHEAAQYLGDHYALGTPLHGFSGGRYGVVAASAAAAGAVEAAFEFVADRGRSGIGLPLRLLLAGPAVALNMTVYEVVVAALRGSTLRLPDGSDARDAACRAAAGAVAGAASYSVQVPAGVLMMHSAALHSSACAALRGPVKPAASPAAAAAAAAAHAASVPPPPLRVVLAHAVGTSGVGGLLMRQHWAFYAAACVHSAVLWTVADY